MSHTTYAPNPPDLRKGSSSDTLTIFLKTYGVLLRRPEDLINSRYDFRQIDVCKPGRFLTINTTVFLILASFFPIFSKASIGFDTDSFSKMWQYITTMGPAGIWQNYLVPVIFVISGVVLIGIALCRFSIAEVVALLELSCYFIVAFEISLLFRYVISNGLVTLFYYLPKLGAIVDYRYANIRILDYIGLGIGFYPVWHFSIKLIQQMKLQGFLLVVSMLSIAGISIVYFKKALLQTPVYTPTPTIVPLPPPKASKPISPADSTVRIRPVSGAIKLDFSWKKEKKDLFLLTRVCIINDSDSLVVLTSNLNGKVLKLEQALYNKGFTDTRNFTATSNSKNIGPHDSIEVELKTKVAKRELGYLKNQLLTDEESQRIRFYLGMCISKREFTATNTLDLQMTNTIRSNRSGAWRLQSLADD